MCFSSLYERMMIEQRGWVKRHLYSELFSGEVLAGSLLYIVSKVGSGLGGCACFRHLKSGKGLAFVCAILHFSLNPPGYRYDNRAWTRGTM